MKSKDFIALNAYKNYKVEIQKNQTAKNAKPLTYDLQLQILSKYCKSLEDAIVQFSAANREYLVSEYRSELEVLQKLLPEPVSESQIYSELCNLQLDTASENGYSVELDKPIIPKKEMGNIIKYLKSKFPTADGKMISDIVKKYIV